MCVTNPWFSGLTNHSQVPWTLVLLQAISSTQLNVVHCTYMYMYSTEIQAELFQGRPELDRERP